MIANLDVVNALADRLDDTTTLVSKDDGEGSLRVAAGKGIRVTIKGKARCND